MPKATTRVSLQEPPKTCLHFLTDISIWCIAVSFVEDNKMAYLLMDGAQSPWGYWCHILDTESVRNTSKRINTLGHTYTERKATAKSIFLHLPPFNMTVHQNYQRPSGNNVVLLSFGVNTPKAAFKLGRCGDGGSANYLWSLPLPNENNWFHFLKDLCAHLRSVHVPLEFVHIEQLQLRMPKQYRKLPTCGQVVYAFMWRWYQYWICDVVIP